MTTPPRDPRINPMAGDVIRKGPRTRTVARIVQNEILYKRDGQRWESGCLIRAWRAWAKKAEIVTAAETL